MAMTQRERFLALGVGVVVGLFGLQYAISSVQEKLHAKQDLVDAARSERDAVNRIETSGVMATRKLNQLNAKSLPAKQEVLVSQYKAWLTKTAMDAGMTDIKIVTPESPFKTTSAYQAYKFRLTGECRPDQWLDLMGAYYDMDYLHTIQSVGFTMTKVPSVIKVTLDSQALALKGASPSQEPSGKSSGRLAMSVDEYKQAILNRNAFSPPNLAPKFAKSSFDIPRGLPWPQILDTQDPENHDVNIELVKAPDGLSLKGKTLNWTPTENGKYEVLVKARDNGWPNMETEQKLTLNVVDPPAPEAPPVKPPKFDAATQTFVSGIVSGRSGPEAWIRSRTEGTSLKLLEGADFEIGSIKAKIVGIHLKGNFLELESEGRLWIIGMDTSLADAFAKSQID